MKRKNNEMNDTKGKVNELHINLLGKLLFAASGAWLVGKLTGTKIRGTKEEIQSLANALISSKKFQDELRKPGATVQSVSAKLNVKNMSASDFKRVFGIQWPM